MSDCYMEGKKCVYRASAFAGCPRCILHYLSGESPTPRPQVLIEAAEDGNKFESTLNLPGSQRVVELDFGSCIIRGHIDGEEDGLLLEAKNMSASRFNKFKSSGIEAFPLYAYQVSVYCLGIGAKKVKMIVRNKETDETIETIIPRPKSYKQIKAKIDVLENIRLNRAEEICDKSSFFCPWPNLCDTKETLYDQTIEPLMLEQIKINQEQRYLKARSEEIKMLLVTRATMLGLDLECAYGSVNKRTRKALSTTLVQKYYPEVKGDSRCFSESEFFQITAKEPKNEE